MKKTITFLLTAAMMLSLLIMPWSAETKEDEPFFKTMPYGDVTNDGKVDDLDAVRILRHFANWKGVIIDTELSNVNGDSSVNDKDAVLLLRYVAGWKLDTKIGEEGRGELEITINNPSEMTEGEQADVSCDVSVKRIETNEKPVITYFYTSSDTSVSVHDNKIEAKKPGQSTVTVQATAYYEKADVSIVGSARLPIKVNAVDGTKKTFDSITETQNGADLGIDMAQVEDGGYIIKNTGDKLVLSAKDDEGLDEGRNYINKTFVNAENKYEVAENLYIEELKGNPVKSLTVAGSDISGYTVVIPSEYDAIGNADDADTSVEFAAGMIRRYVFYATGYAPEIVNDINNAADKNKVITIIPDNSGDLGKEGFVISVKDGKIDITGGMDRGVIYGAYELLERYIGWRFMFNDKEYIYSSEHVDIPNGIMYKAIPVMEYRDVSGGVKNHEGYKLARKLNNDETSDRYGGGIGTTWYHAHSFGYQITKYYTDVHGFTDDGKVPEGIFQTQPCLTNEENFQECKQSILDLIDDRQKDPWNLVPGKPGLDLITVAWNDNDNYCKCSKCKAVYEEEGSISGTLVRFANRMADEISAKYPDIQIFTLGYGTNASKPTKTKLRDNVVVCYCWSGCNNHYFSAEDCKDGARPYMGKRFENKSEREKYEGWVDNSATTHVWYYCGNYQYYLSPLSIVDNIYYDFKFLSANGCDGIYAEMGGSDKMLAFEPLHVYLMSRCMWDPNMSKAEYDRLKEEYLELYFGDGWQELSQYLDMSTEAGNEKGDWLTNFSWPQEMANIDYYAEHYEEMTQLFDKAEALAKTSEQKYLIQKARLHMEFLALSGMYDEYYGENATDEQKAFYAEKYTALYEFITDAKKPVDERNPIKILGSGDGFGKITPEIKNPLKEWYDFKDGDFEY